MSARDSYITYVTEAEQWAQKKRERETSIRLLAKDAFTGHTPRTSNDTWQFAAQGSIATDQLLKEWEVMRSRAVANATMYGIGAIIDALINR
jgi:hypothetical protein